MSNSISNSNAKTNTLDAIVELRENMNYIKKFRLSLNVTQHINFQVIFKNVYINNPTFTSNIKLNSYVFHYFESY